MKGQVKFRIYDKDNEYRFTLKRNITIIQGESGTGKTTLLQAMFNSMSGSSAAAYTVETSANYFVYTRAFKKLRWETVLAEITDSVIFIEENNRFVYSNDFAKYVKKSGNYFVIIGRKPLKGLPYSWQEIYELVSHKGSGDLRRIYEFKEFYTNFTFTDYNFDLVIMEDSNAGFTFFEDFFSNVPVISANGNGNVLNTILAADASNILCIVDGAAFGSYLQEYYDDFENGRHYNKRITIWPPESFEWVLLKAGVFTCKNLDKILENPSDYIECSSYASWERFFTALAEESSEAQWKYNKNRLDDYYLTSGIKKKVNDVLPKELQDLAKKKTHGSKTINTIKMSLF